MAGAYQLEVTMDGQPVGARPVQSVTVMSSAFWSPGTALAAATQPIVAGQEALLQFSTSDRFGNPYLEKDLVFSLIARGVGVATARVSGPISEILDFKVKRVTLL